MIPSNYVTGPLQGAFQSIAKHYLKSGSKEGRGFFTFYFILFYFFTPFQTYTPPPSP